MKKNTHKEVAALNVVDLLHTKALGDASEMQ
jgi:hypothetical protein